jgi:hypothetical protein
MKIHLSFDYELFFGANSGTVHKCMLEPTERLLVLATKHQVPLIFFVDAGYIFALQKHAHETACAKDYDLVKNQLLKILQAGHEIGLHIHPHWEDSSYSNGSWNISTRRYKLADFSETEAHQIFTKYHQALTDVTGVPCKSFRAGGWCIQPFSHMRKALSDNGIYTDSSVYPGGHHDSPAHAFDFRNAPQQDEWRFESNECEISESGRFHEVPITPDVLSPLFYWELYGRMKLNPAMFKPIGDGSWLKDKKRIYTQFYRSTQHFACADGYFASRLKPILEKQLQQKRTRMMVLSHPKSMAECSFVLLEKFIIHAKQQSCKFHTLTGKHA